MKFLPRQLFTMKNNINNSTAPVRATANESINLYPLYTNDPAKLHTKLYHPYFFFA